MRSLTHKNTTVVISTWKGTSSVAWKEHLIDRGYKVLVYDHCNNKIDPLLNIPKNRGKEASVYLKYICDNYNKLPEYSMFLHDENLSWHHVGEIWKRVLGDPPSSSVYRSYNSDATCLGSITDGRNTLWNDGSMIAWFDKYLGPYIGDHSIHGDWTKGHKCCAQFAVHKSMILQHDKKLYTDLYKWILHTDIDMEISSRFMEWTWMLLFVPK